MAAELMAQFALSMDQALTKHRGSSPNANSALRSAPVTALKSLI